MTGRRRIAAAAGSIFAAVVMGIGSPASGSAPEQSANVVARDAEGVILQPDPSLKPGQRITLTITGFHPLASVQMRLAGQSSGTRYRADKFGVLRLRYLVARAHKGADFVLTFIGAPPDGPTGKAPLSATGDNQITAVVPTLGFFGYSISGPGSHGGNPGGSGAGGAGGVAGTGTDVQALLTIAALLLAAGLGAGLGAVGLSRRRRGGPGIL
jgi:hypothetical protein